MMSSNEVFYNFLKLSMPSFADKFKKAKHIKGYETYVSLKSAKHKFIYDTAKQIITHLFYKTTIKGSEYGVELTAEKVKVILQPKGFRTIKIS